MTRSPRIPPRIVAVIFEVTTESNRQRFNIPKGVTTLLRLKPKDEIALTIKDANSCKELYAGTQTLKSGREIYGSEDVSEALEPNQRIRVKASRPD
jgi:hypothetical protein